MSIRNIFMQNYQTYLFGNPSCLVHVLCPHQGHNNLYESRWWSHYHLFIPQERGGGGGGCTLTCYRRWRRHWGWGIWTITAISVICWIYLQNKTCQLGQRKLIIRFSLAPGKIKNVLKRWYYILFCFVLRFYGPVNPMGSCRAQSVYLTTRLLGRLSPLSG